jgi:type-F conjugative transfer system pilin assembly protein TrbC
MGGKTMLRYAFMISFFTITVLAKEPVDHDLIREINESLENYTDEIAERNENSVKNALKALDNYSEKKVLNIDEFDNSNPIYQQNVNVLMEQVDKATESHSRGGVTKEMEITGIADKNLASERVRILNAMGIDASVSGYVFVSRSMPNSLIRAYSIEAERLGLSLVFRGFSNGGFNTNYTKEFGRLFHTRSDAMSIQIDPRLFDVFNIERVPSILLTDIPSLSMCNGQVEKTKFSYSNQIFDYTRCQKADSDRYCKIDGAVDADWAIKKMSANGCALADSYLATLEKQPDLEMKKISEDDWNSHNPVFWREVNKLNGEYIQNVDDMLNGDFK